MKGTILIASSALSGRKLRLLTQREETDVFFCETSREALEYLIKQTPDFIVLDQNLESVPGLDIIRKVRNVKRLHEVPTVLLDFSAELKLIPEDKKLIDLHIKGSITESELLNGIYQYKAKTATPEKPNTDLKSTLYLEQAISNLNSDEAPKTLENLTKAQESMLSPKDKLAYLEKEVERLKTVVNKYQECFGDINSDRKDNKPWLDALLKPVF